MPTENFETDDRGASAPDPTRPRPPRGQASIAAFVCRETEGLGREVGFPLAIISATAHVGRHAARLSATLYAGCMPREYRDWPLCFDEGYAPPSDLAYRQLDLDPRWLGPAALPRDVVLEAGSLGVTLPEGASVADLSAALRTNLANLSFDRVVRRPDRVRHRYRTHRPVVVAPRYALVAPGDIERVTVADDLFKFHPCDLAKVAGALSRSLGVLGSAMTQPHARAEGARHG